MEPGVVRQRVQQERFARLHHAARDAAADKDAGVFDDVVGQSMGCRNDQRVGLRQLEQERTGLRVHHGCRLLGNHVQQAINLHFVHRLADVIHRGDFADAPLHLRLRDGDLVFPERLPQRDEKEGGQRLGQRVPTVLTPLSGWPPSIALAALPRFRSIRLRRHRRPHKNHPSGGKRRDKTPRARGAFLFQFLRGTGGCPAEPDTIERHVRHAPMLATPAPAAGAAVIEYHRPQSWPMCCRIASVESLVRLVFIRKFLTSLSGTFSSVLSSALDKYQK